MKDGKLNITHTSSGDSIKSVLSEVSFDAEFIKDTLFSQIDLLDFDAKISNEYKDAIHDFLNDYTYLSV